MSSTASLPTAPARPASHGSTHEPSTSLAIKTVGLTKRFGEDAVVDDLDLAVPAGSVFGFLGPNGAGKTTTIRMVLGLLTPTEGHAEVLGQRMPDGEADVLPHVGALIEGPAFYPWLSGEQNLLRFDSVSRVSTSSGRAARVGLALERVGLTAAAAKRYKAYSLGMRQRLGLACALLEPRSLLVLDEPTNGMDPQGTREIRHLVRELAADGTTVFLSSHLLAEIEQVCTHVAVMNLGRLVTQGSLADLQATAAVTIRIETSDTHLAISVLAALGLLASVDSEGRVTATLPDPRTPPAADIARALVLGGVGLSAFGVVRPSLEDMFVSLTGEGFDVAR